MIGWRQIAMAAAVAGTVATPAAAVRTRYHFFGVVDAVFFTPGALGVVPGGIAEVDVYADPSTRIDVTAAANAALGTHYTHLEAASLGSPLDSLSLFVHTATPGDLIQLYRSDQAGALDALGVSAPYVLFDNSRFAGIGFFGINALGELLATRGATPQPFDFVGGAAGVGAPSFAGHFDYTNVPGVPEPANWALMVAGFGLVGVGLRRGRAQTGLSEAHLNESFPMI